MKPRSIKVLIQLISGIFPAPTSRFIHKLLSNPQVLKTRTREKAVLDRASRGIHNFEGFEIVEHRWGSQFVPCILLIHGWEGHSGNFGGLIDTLLGLGYQVISYDAPAHGQSSTGPTDMFQFGRFLKDRIIEQSPEVMISHSFGTTFTALALQNAQVETLKHWFMVASPYTFQSRLDTVQQLYQVPVSIMQRVASLVEQASGHTISSLNFKSYRQGFPPINDIHIIHSLEDQVVPYAYAEDILQALPRAKLNPLENLGHFGILWSEGLKRYLSESLDRSSPRT